MTAPHRRDRVLIEDAATVAKKLKANPGVNHLIAVGDLSDARVLAQTAYRIRQNYRIDEQGIRRGLKDFAADERGEFDATSTANQSRPNKVAAVELHAKYILHSD